MKNEKPVKVLLIEDETDSLQAMQEGLKNTPFNLETADRLSSGLKRLAEGGIGLVLLDLGLPDAQGLETFSRIRSQVPRLPIVVLTGLDDERIAIKTVQEGAQDYLVKGQVSRTDLIRALRYAIQRHELQEELRSLSLVDEMTGLHNRRGFMTLAAQQLKLADRTKRASLLIFADLDQMKWINDHLGHAEGDRALIEVTEVLKETFRGSDIIARYGGDEFVILAIEYSAASDELVMGRLKKNLDHHNAQPSRRYKLDLSIGTARYDPEAPTSLEDLITQADAAMYRQKRNKHK